MDSSQVVFSDNDWPSHNLVQLFNRAHDRGQIAIPDCAVIANTLLDPTTSQEDLILIDRLCWAIWRGRITITDDANFLSLDTFKVPKPSMHNDGVPHWGKFQPVGGIGASMASAI